MNLLSDRILNMSTSATLAMAAKTRELRAEGKDIIGLSLGEPDFNTPDYIKEAAIQAINDNYSSYTPVDGYVELKEAIIKKFKRDNNLIYTASQIVVSTGAKQSLANVAAVLINKGDEVIIPCPYWVSYADLVKLNEGIPVEVKTSIDTDFKITPKQLEAAITSKTKMIWYSSPCNPSGSVYSKEELRALADVLQKHPNIIVVSDEIYEHINFIGEHASMAQFDDMFNRTVTVNGVSKAALVSLTINPKPRSSHRDSIIGAHINPRPCVAMKFIISGVVFRAAMRKSPSFSLSSSSTTIITFPALMSSMASLIESNFLDM